MVTYCLFSMAKVRLSSCCHMDFGNMHHQAHKLGASKVENIKYSILRHQLGYNCKTWLRLLENLLVAEAVYIFPISQSKSANVKQVLFEALENWMHSFIDLFFQTRHCSKTYTGLECSPCLGFVIARITDA